MARTICKIEDCSIPRHGQGYCVKHYKRLLRNGNPLIAKCAPNGDRKKHSLYSLYTNIKTRCYNESNQAYKDYGGRGITMCDRWLGIDGFKNFVADMGERPTGHSIDRINNSLGYTPENCHWATSHEQALNRRIRRDSSVYFLITQFVLGVTA